MWLTGRVCILHGDAGQGMVHIQGGTKQDCVRFHHITQNNIQFKTYELFLSGIFHLMFLE